MAPDGVGAADPPALTPQQVLVNNEPVKLTANATNALAVALMIGGGAGAYAAYGPSAAPSSGLRSADSSLGSAASAGEPAMTAHDAFVTFGLPAIAVAGALLGLWITTRNANRLRGGPAKAKELGGK